MCEQSVSGEFDEMSALTRFQGAKLLVGGEKVTPSEELSGGVYISPAVFVNVNDDMRIAREVCENNS